MCTSSAACRCEAVQQCNRCRVIDDLSFVGVSRLFKEKLQTSDGGRVLLGSATVVCKCTSIP